MSLKLTFFSSQGLFIILLVYTVSSAEISNVITSENYPLKYPSLSNRVYRFEIPGADRILITFTNFSIEYSFNCNADALEIFYSSDNTYKFLTNYCGSWEPFSLVMNSPKGAFRMRSDSAVESQGFRAEYLAIQGDCDRTVNNTEGILMSPRYHNKYPNNVDHYVTILNRNGSRIVLRFTVFDIHPSDFLEVQDGTSPFSPVLETLSGNTLPDTIYSYGDGLRLHLKSDFYFTRAGYIVNYTVEEVKECLYTDRGTEYIGTESVTESGIPCMNWKNLNKSYGFQHLPRNFCRNPDGRKSPWCYSSPGVVGYCSIKKCQNPIEQTTQLASKTENTVEIVKSEVSGQKENGVTKATPRETRKTTTRIPKPVGKPDDTGEDHFNNGGVDSPNRDLLVPITVGGVSFFVAVLALLLLIAKRKHMRNSRTRSVQSSPDLHQIDEMASTTTSGEVRYGRSKYHPSNIHIPSEEITYTAIDNVETNTNRSDSSTSGSLDPMDTTLRRFRDGKRLAMHFDEDGYGIVDDEIKDGFDDKRFDLKRTRDGDYDHLSSFKVKWRKADEETEALYDHCQAEIIRESKQGSDIDDTYDHTSTVLMNKVRKSKDQSASESNIYQDCMSEKVTSI
ncbi:neuropilin-1-like [Saccostrea echinata]|uniref:neuropilin-1-like n=1 Tax=Saccostrea echinata TaxID=191078 RepID=UPI002A818F34|nr:neuropilin-1-like [Saccostrea echinata]